MDVIWPSYENPPPVIVSIVSPKSSVFAFTEEMNVVGMYLFAANSILDWEPMFPTVSIAATEKT